MQGPGADNWMCPCGARNLAASATCYRCGQARAVLAPVGAGVPGPIPTGLLVTAAAGRLGMTYRVAPQHPVSLGTGPRCTVQLVAEPDVLPEHARFYWTDSGYVLEPLGPAGTTLVNGYGLSGPVLVRDGDVVQVGRTQFRFALEASPHPVLPVPQYGVPYYGTPVAPKDRVTAALLAFFLGSLGIHLFYLGNTGWGIAFLAFNLVWLFGGCVLGLATLGLSMLLWWIGPTVMGVTCLLQTILYLTANDADFHQKYVVEKRLL